MSANKKVPNYTRGISYKTPSIEKKSIPDPNHKPVWRFGFIDMDGPFSWKAINDIGFFYSEIIQKIKSFESMTYGEIIAPTFNDNHHHILSPEKLSKDAIKRLDEIKLKEEALESLFSFALTGKRRVICFLKSQIFYFLWWDPKHEVSPSHKKHT